MKKIGGESVRTESEILNAVLKFASEDPRIRAVFMNGSWVNPHTKSDIFQDYDIVYIMSSMNKLVRDRSWIRNFGELIMMQTPDENVLSLSNRDAFAFLMLFADGNRMDLTLYPLEKLDQYRPESLSVLLMDKDGMFGKLPPANDSDYLIKSPTKREFSSCCNEFWWVSTYVAKGLARRQLPYANFMFEHPVRDMSTLMLKWFVGVDTNFSANVGAGEKYFEQYLPPNIWATYLMTFLDSEYENRWKALFTTCELFRDMALVVARALGYTYPILDDQRVSGYLRYVRKISTDIEPTF